MRTSHMTLCVYKPIVDRRLKAVWHPTTLDSYIVGQITNVMALSRRNPIEFKHVDETFYHFFIFLWQFISVKKFRYSIGKFAELTKGANNRSIDLFIAIRGTFSFEIEQKVFYSQIIGNHLCLKR